jgi:hypothetical protein
MQVKNILQITHVSNTLQNGKRLLLKNSLYKNLCHLQERVLRESHLNVCKKTRNSFAGGLL